MQAAFAQDAAEQVEPIVRAEGRHALGEQGALFVLLFSRHHADAVPEAPVDDCRRSSVGVAVMGEGVEERVPCRVAAEHGGVEEGRAGREQDEALQGAVVQEAVQVPRAGDLGGQDRVEFARGQVAQRCVVDDAGGVEDAADRWKSLATLRGQEFGHGLLVGDVGCCVLHCDTTVGQRLQDGQGRGLGVVGGHVSVRGGQRAPAGEQEVACALVGQPESQAASDTARASGDQVGALAVNGDCRGANCLRSSGGRRAERQDDLPGVAGLGHEPEGGCRLFGAELGVGECLKCPLADESCGGAQDASGPLGRVLDHVDHVDGVEGQVAGERTEAQRVVVENVALAQLQIVPVRRHQGQVGRDGLTGQGVEDGVEVPFAFRGLEGVREVEGAGVGDVLHAEAGQQVALGFAAGGGVDTGALPAGDVEGGHSRSAGGGVDEDLVAAVDAGEVVQGVIRGEVGGRQGGGLGRGEPGGLGCGQAGARDDVGAQRALGEGDDLVADGDVGDLDTDLGDDAGALPSEDRRPVVLTGVHAESQQHVAVVDSGVADLDTDLVHSHGTVLSVGQPQIVDDAGRGQGQDARCGREGRRRTQPSRVARAVAQGYLVLLVGLLQYVDQGGDAGRGPVEVHQPGVEHGGFGGEGAAQAPQDGLEGVAYGLAGAGGLRELGDQPERRVTERVLVQSPGQVQDAVSGQEVRTADLRGGRVEPGLGVQRPQVDDAAARAFAGDVPEDGRVVVGVGRVDAVAVSGSGRAACPGGDGHYAVPAAGQFTDDGTAGRAAVGQDEPEPFRLGARGGAGVRGAFPVERVQPVQLAFLGGNLGEFGMRHGGVLVVGRQECGGVAGQVLQAQTAHLRDESTVVSADVEVGGEGVLAGGRQQTGVAPQGGGGLLVEAHLVDAAEHEDALFSGSRQRAGSRHGVSARIEQSRVEVVPRQVALERGGAGQVGKDLAVGAPQLVDALEGAVPLVAAVGVPGIKGGRVLVLGAASADRGQGFGRRGAGCGDGAGDRFGVQHPLRVVRVGVLAVDTAVQGAVFAGRDGDLDLNSGPVLVQEERPVIAHVGDGQRSRVQHGAGGRGDQLQVSSAGQDDGVLDAVVAQVAVVGEVQRSLPDAGIAFGGPRSAEQWVGDRHVDVP